MAKSPRYGAVLLALVIVGAGAGLLIGFLRSGGSPAAIPPATRTGEGPPADPTPDNPYTRFAVSDFTLTDQDGEPIDQSVFDGEVTVLTFFFTSCPDPCPAIQRAMADVQERTAGTEVRLASISVDGGHDTPRRIRDYGAGYGADFARWAFMTGDPEVVGSLVQDSISFTMRDRDDLTITRPDGTKLAQILHPIRLILVGPDRRVLGLYAYNDADAIDDLVTEARAAAGG